MMAGDQGDRLKGLEDRMRNLEIKIDQLINNMTTVSSVESDVSH